MPSSRDHTGEDRKFAIATDLDDTLVGDERALRHFNDFVRTHRNSLFLVYLTGRYFRSASDLMRQENLIPPDVLVTDVGAEIRWGPGYKLDERWNSRAVTNWDEERIVKILQGIPWLQPRTLKSKLRRSYSVLEVIREVEDEVNVVKEIKSRLLEFGVKAEVVLSSGKDLDVLPAGVSKGQALTHICRTIPLEPSRVLVCGDSGNDISMLDAGFNAVVVNNAQAELKRYNFKNPVYFAKGEYAWAIIEGLNRYFRLPTS